MPVIVSDWLIAEIALEFPRKQNATSNRKKKKQKPSGEEEKKNKNTHLKFV